MSTKPILFNTDMVRAILDGRKTVTRRVVKGANPEWPFLGLDDDMVVAVTKNGVEIERELPGLYLVLEGPRGEYETFKAPYRPGDILYVRETWYYETFYEDTDNAPDLPYGNRSWRYVYKADNPDYPVIPGHWRPSIHMPQVAARIFLRVTDVRVERLQDMPPYDIAFEGFRRQQDFKALWDNTLKPKDRALYGWAANPWVWVVAFEKVSRKEALSCPLTT